MDMSHPERHPDESSTPSVEDSLAAIDALCDLWDQQIPGTTRYRDGIDSPRAVGIMTHSHHAVRIARAIRRLATDFLGIEIVPLVRLLMECAVTAAWLLLTPGSGDSMILDGARQRKKALSAIALHGGETEPAHSQAMSVLQKLEAASGPKNFAFEQRCLSLADGQRLYTTYRVLSLESHGGIGVSDFYIATSKKSPIGFFYNPNAQSSRREATLGLAACMLHLAMNADESARSEPSMRSKLNEWASILGIDATIVGVAGRHTSERDC